MKIISAFVGIIVFSIAMFILFSSIGTNSDGKFKYIKWFIYCISELVIGIVSLIIFYE